MFWKQKVKDPVCGMSVDPKTAIARTIAGKTYYFCSEGCANSYADQLSGASGSKNSPEMSGRQGHSTQSSDDGESHGCC